MKRKLLILFLTCVVGWLHPINAQTITIGSGTSTYNRVPLYSSKSSSSSQLIYTKTDINKADGASISAIAFNQSATNTYGGNIKLKVYMQNTDKESFSSTSDFVSFGDSDLYFDGEIAILDAQSGWINIELDKSFSYDGNKNLLIGIQHYEGATYSAANFYYTSVSEDRAWHYYSGGSYSTKKYSPNIQITFAEPEFAVTVSADDTEINIDETVTLTAEVKGGSGSYTLSWSCTPAGGELISTDIGTATFTPTSAGTYNITCTVIDTNNEEEVTSNVVTVTVTGTDTPDPGESAIDLNKQYRIKVYSGNNGVGHYLTAHDNYSISTSNLSNVSTKTSVESNTQIFTIEQYAENTYYLKTLDGYYIKCNAGTNSWNVDCYSTSAKTPLLFEYVDDNDYFYIRDTEKNSTNNYFKVDSDGKVYCDKPKNDSGTVTWVLEEYVKPPLEITSANASASEVYNTGTEVTLTVSATGGSGNYTYSWTCTQGTPAMTDFYNTNQAEATFKPTSATSAGTYKFTCTVNDGTSSVTSEEIEVVVLDSSTKCTIVFEMTDGYGDTWDGSYLKVEYNGNVVNVVYTDPDTGSIGETTIEETLDVPTGSQITVSFVSGGGYYDSECSYVIKYEDGTIIYSPQSAVGSEVTFEACGDIPLMLTLSADNDAKGCEGSDIQLTATATGGTENYTYTWEIVSGGGSLDDATAANPTFTLEAVGSGTASNEVTLSCTADDGETEVSDEITLTVCKKPAFELSTQSVVVNYGETATIEVVYEPEPSYMNITCPSPEGVNYTYKTKNSADPDTIVLSYVPTVDADLVFEAENYYSYSSTIGGNLCKETKTVEVRVINENKEVEIGTNENLFSRNYLPVKTDVKYSLTQQIYTASELGINEASEITSISFYTTGKYAQNARNIEIYVAHTDLNTFVDGNPNSTEYASALANDFVNMTGEPNFSGEVTFESGWTEITFTTPFQYEVGKNVILTVNDITGTTDYTNDYAHYSTGNELRSIVMYNSSAAYDATNITADGYTPNDLKQNNNIKFKYQAIAQDELVATINVDDAEICDGENSNRFEMYATRVENATYDWYLVVDEVDNLLEENVREYTYSNANPGTYTIKLVVTQNDVTKEVTKELTINPMPNAAVVMGTNGYGFVGEPIGFATTEDHVEGTTYAMVLTVDLVPYNYSSVEYDTHNFEDDGTFYYTVEASIGECETSSTKSIIIYPVAKFTAEDACKDQEVVFTNTTDTPNSGGAWNFGEGEGFVWNFGDGTVLASNEETVTHTYTEVGDYNVTLTVTKSGISKVASKTVTVSEIPVAEFNYDGTEALTDITFTATNAGDGANYTWNFGDDTEEVVVNSAEVTHQYALPGEYTVTLTVTRNGCSSTAEQAITVVVKESGAAIEPEYVDLGYRPSNGWMRPYIVNITPDGNTSLTINSLTVEEYDNYFEDYDFIGLSHEQLPVTLEPGEKFPVKVSINILEEGDFIDVNFNILVNGEVPTNQTEEYTGYCSLYPAGEGDIFELPLVIDPFLGEESIPIEYAGELISNYLLPGADEETTYYDAVYKFTILEDPANLTVTVKDSEGNNTNALAYVYPEDFGGEDGPGLTNYVGYQAPYVPPFEGFSFTLENDLSFGVGYTEGTGWRTGSEGGLENMYADLDWNTSAKYFRSHQSNGENELNYFITTDKYYISETARLSMSTWVDDSNMKYYVFVSEDGYEFTTVEGSEGVVSSETAVTVDVDLSDYVGEYYVGIMHVGAESSGGEGNFYLDDITLYEPETRAARASAESSLEIMLEAGTYYLVVAAATDPNFSVTTNAETLSAPVAAYKPGPSYGSTDISTEYKKLTWEFGANTAEYQVLFGTSSTPTEVVVDWNSYVENNYYDLSELGYALEDNTVYYWRVNARNFAGTTEGPIWYFATPFDAPQNLVLTPNEINLGGTATLTWDAIDHASGYKIWKGNEPLTEEPITETTYDIEVLEFSAEPYEIQVEAVYNVDEVTITSKSRTIELTINAEALVEGYVLDATTLEPLEGATVTYATTELTTRADGYYSGSVPAGNYTAVARMAGYNKDEVEVELVPSENAYTQNFKLESTLTMVSNVVATENAGKTAVDVEWQFNLVGDPMIETFENGFTYEWETSEDYPWTVVANGFVENTAGYEAYGGYCVKSTNSDYDYDQEHEGYREDGNYPLQNTTSYLQLTVHIPFDGKIKFDYKLEADSYGGDRGLFYIDDEIHTILGAGDFTDWETTTFFECEVTAGTHIFKWEYAKDDGWYYGSDAFYIDNISFYESTNVYNVYLKDILKDNTTSLVADYATKEFKYEDLSWETRDDGIYQWGVSVEYNEPAGDLLNEDFEGVEEPETFLTGWTKYTEEVDYELFNQWHVAEEGEYDIPACEGTGYSAFVSPLPGESVFYFVTPMVNASRQATLEFDYIIPCYKNVDVEFPNDFSKFKVAYSTSQTGPWTDLTAFNKTSIENWTHATVELPLEEELYIAFIDQNVENWGLGIGLDNVRIHRVAVNGTSEIAWSNIIGKGNELVNDGDWNDENNWSREIVPTVDEVAIIKAAGTVNGADAVADAVLVDNGTLTIGESGVLTASTVIDSVAADITINAGGQLVHSNAGVMAKFVKGIKAYEDVDANTGWYTISSPLAANIDASDVDYLLDGEFDLYRYDEPTHYWENYEDNVDDDGPDNDDWDNNSAVIEKGRGYLYANSADKQLSFVGELNVADVTTTLSAEASSLTGFNLLGNPFAHNIYKGAAFNGSIADAHYTLNYHGEWQVVTSDNPIKSGAGFLVQATEGANLTISKTNAQTRAAANSMLAVTVVNNVFEDVAYVSFNDGIGLEKIGHMNEYAPMVYIPGDFNNYAYATVEEDVTEVPVNFEAMTMGEYTIAVKAKNCEYETMILVDNLTGKETNLLKDSYTFMATTTDDPDRFVIKLAKDAEVEDSFIYINNGELIFDNLSSDAIINVFDVLGRNVATFNNCGDTTFRVSTDLFADGVYMVRVIEGNNVKVQKMVIE